MYKNYWKQLILIITLSTSISASDIAEYYAFKIEIMENTLLGYNKLLNCLNTSCPQVEYNKLSDAMQNKLNQIYNKRNTSSSKELGFYTKHKAQADSYFYSHPNLKEKYEGLLEKLANIHTQINKKL